MFSLFKKKRRVKYKGRKWNESNDPTLNSFYSNVEGVGDFHCWGTTLEEDERGFHETTVAIVETYSGEVVTIIPENIKFIKY